MTKISTAKTFIAFEDVVPFHDNKIDCHFLPTPPPVSPPLPLAVPGAFKCYKQNVKNSILGRNSIKGNSHLLTPLNFCCTELTIPVVNLVAVPGLLPDAEIIDESNWNILRNPNVSLGILNCNATLNFRTVADPGRLSCSLSVENVGDFFCFLPRVPNICISYCLVKYKGFILKILCVQSKWKN